MAKTLGDTTNLPEGDFSVLEVGPQNANVTKVEWTEVKNGPNKGKEMVKVMYTIADGKYKGRTLWQNFAVFNPDMLRVFADFARATGLPEESMKDLDPMSVLNRSVRINVKTKAKYNGAEGELENDVDLRFNKWKSESVPDDIPAVPVPEGSKGGSLPFENVQ